jgi:hypothetical protein
MPSTSTSLLTRHARPRERERASEREKGVRRGKKPGLRLREKPGQTQATRRDGDGGAATRGEAPPPLPHRTHPLPGGRGRAFLRRLSTVRRRPFLSPPLSLWGWIRAKGICSYSANVLEALLRERLIRVLMISAGAQIFHS